MKYQFAAIPTKYAGVNFRSRLEARWAAFFDLCGWKWEYEPFDLKGWTPDFVIGDPRRGVFVEVKPIIFPPASCNYFYNQPSTIFGDFESELISAFKCVPSTAECLLVLGTHPPCGEDEQWNPNYVGMAWSKKHPRSIRRVTLVFKYKDASSTHLGWSKYVEKIDFILDCTPRYEGAIYGESWDDLGPMGDSINRHIGATELENPWREAGNRVQWRKTPLQSA